MPGTGRFLARINGVVTDIAMAVARAAGNAGLPVALDANGNFPVATVAPSALLGSKLEQGVHFLSLPNGAFEDLDATGQPEGWTYAQTGTGAGSIDQTAANKLTGSNSVKMVLAANADTVTYTSPVFPCGAGIPFTAFARAKSSGSKGRLTVTANWFTNNKSTANGTATLAQVTGLPTAYAEYGATVTPPSGTSFASVTVAFDSAADTAWLDELRTQRASNVVATGSGSSPALRYGRLIEDRATDAISVMEYIPVALRAGITARNGTADLSTYIQNAWNDAPGNVYFPAGDYLLLNPISGPLYKKLLGQGVNLSRFMVNSSFKMSSAYVVQLNQYSGIDGIAIVFDQSAATSRSNLIQYPWALDLTQGSRSHIGHIRIQAAWNGINANQAPQGNGFDAQVIEIGAFNQGIIIDKVLDFTHIDVLNLWPWDFAYISGGVLLGIYEDGVCVGVTINECDGLEIGRLTSFTQSVVIGTSSTSAYRHINVVELDGDGATIQIDGPTLGVDHLSTTKTNGLNNIPSIRNRSGLTRIGTIATQGQETVPQVQTTGGTLVIGGGTMTQINNAQPAAESDGGVMVLNDVYLNIPSNAARSKGYVAHGSGYLVMHGCSANPIGSGSNAGSGSLVTFTSDQPGNDVSGNGFAGWGFSPPPSIATGTYGPNGRTVFPFTPALTITTPGNFSPSYSVQTGRIYLDADGYYFEVRLVFNTNAYSTSGSNAPSGNVVVTGLLFPKGQGAIDSSGLNVNWSMVTLSSGYTSLNGFIQDGATNVTLRQSGSGVGAVTIGASSFPPSTNGFELFVSGFVQTR